jgi:hypothetical protein
VASQYCGQRMDVLLRGNTSDEEEKVRSVRWEIGRIRGRPGLSCRVVTRLAVCSFLDFGTEGAHQTQLAAVESANRQQQKQQDITLCTDRRLLEASVQTLRHAGRRDLSHPLGELSTGEQTQCNAITLPCSLAGSHVSSGNECRQPHGRRSRASDSKSKGGVCEVGVETGDWRCPSARLCLAAFMEPRSALHARPEGTAKHNTCEMHMSTCTRVQAYPAGWVGHVPCLLACEHDYAKRVIAMASRHSLPAYKALLHLLYAKTHVELDELTAG